MILKHLAIAVASLVVTVAIRYGDALQCTSDHLATFKETTIAAPINKCSSASEVKFSMPPTADLTETQRDQICSERICKEMIAAIDDMDVPRCDLLYNGKNVTLQGSLDRFTAICDAPRTAPEVKKRNAKKSGNAASTAATVGTGSVTMLVGLGVLVLLAASVF